ncbi:single-stranded DNA-binding protein [Mucilaginibacter ginkgonis]|uniref:Single-stranded DNA-binding protein n=1 Tax=Mucilaginibacter ginkgonis TaxID=2682091 RepID=A0A6I4HWL1_9SPHI|nr:single-stranded DNA-binding protein [Mucilaginibacter ginkgonis]QQL51225.1 single-stranded DNA-binding protein [Mucilaginibacter ginkgonis]
MTLKYPPQTRVNRVFLLGQISSAPIHEPGNAGITFTLITKEIIPKKESNIEHIEFHFVRVTDKAIFDKTSLHIGKIIHLEGKIHTYSTFEDGIKRYHTEIVAGQLQLF